MGPKSVGFEEPTGGNTSPSRTTLVRFAAAFELEVLIAATDPRTSLARPDHLLRNWAIQLTTELRCSHRLKNRAPRLIKKRG